MLVRIFLFLSITTGFLVAGPVPVTAAPNPKRCYAYDAVEDAHGVIAPWYKGQNGQLDFRVRIAAETLKRYPWALPPKSPAAAPEYVYSGAWKIAADGTITIPPINDWANGDLGQRAFFTLTGLVDYYRYSGDPAAIAHLHVMAETILDHELTGPDHPWPGVLVSVPTKGKPYGNPDPHGFIQLDIVAEVGLGLLRAYQITGNERWLATCKHWGDLFVAHRQQRDTSLPPWSRYANPEDVGWEDTTAGSISCILEFLDELIRLGHTGKDNAIVAARDAGRAYLRDVLLPRWTSVDTWGRNYWDWPCPVQDEITTETAVRYLLDHPDVFPNWRTDARNILSLFLNHTSVAPGSNGDVYHGAWAYPESAGCCGRSLWYAPMELAPVFAQYGVLADDPWGREQGWRQMILATYDCHETGVVEDNIDGGQIVAGDWFKIAHPMALRHALMAIAWQPEIFGAARENHIVRSTAVVSDVIYSKGEILYRMYDAPVHSVDVLRLSFRPARVTAGGANLESRSDLAVNGYTVQALPDGDFLLAVRHDGATKIGVMGNDPQECAGEGEGKCSGAWSHVKEKQGFEGAKAGDQGATALFGFSGNQIRLMGSVGPDGGLADVYIDDVKQLAGIDCWHIRQKHYQTLYYRNGLPAGAHTLKVVVRGAKNPLATGAYVYITGILFSSSAAVGEPASGSGPTGPQRMIFGYSGRTDYVDSAGNAWRPGTEFIVRAGNMADSVAASWWTERRRIEIPGTPDPELYRYGVHAKDFTVYVTVGPGTYHARLKFCETRGVEPKARAMSVAINGWTMLGKLDLAATAGGLNRPADLVFDDLQPQHGVIEIHCAGSGAGEAILQALEVGPGPGGEGAKPVSLPPPAAPVKPAGGPPKQE